jgi:uncharacterized membrane protein YkvA (DUF1232 family)
MSGSKKASSVSRRGARRGLLARPRAVLRLLTDRTAPRFPRFVALLAVVYAIFPFDLIPDVVPVVGWIDDVGLASIAVAFVLSAAARHERRRAAMEEASGDPALAAVM